MGGELHKRVGVIQYQLNEDFFHPTRALAQQACHQLAQLLL
jgi:hypothetical protein